MSGYGIGYTPFRINHKKCNIYPNKCPKVAIDYFYDVKDDTRSTKKMKYSDVIKRLHYGRQGLKFKYVNNTLNAFKSYAGAPGGYGRAPRNSF